jgi:hypothetical protein
MVQYPRHRDAPLEMRSLAGECERFESSERLYERRKTFRAWERLKWLKE